MENNKLRLLVKLCFEGMTNAQIADRLGIDKSRVYNLRSQHNLTMANIKNYKSRKITAQDFINEHFGVQNCGICGNEVTDNLWQFEDGSTTHLCKHCEMVMEYLLKH